MIIMTVYFSCVSIYELMAAVKGMARIMPIELEMELTASTETYADENS